jgi:hypothetical protein
MYGRLLDDLARFERMFDGAHGARSDARPR